MVCKTSPLWRKPRNRRTLDTIFWLGLVQIRDQEVAGSNPATQDSRLRAAIEARFKTSVFGKNSGANPGQGWPCKANASIMRTKRLSLQKQLPRNDLQHETNPYALPA